MSRRAMYLTAMVVAISCLLGPTAAQAETTTTRPFLFSIDGGTTPQGSFSDTFRTGIAIDESSGRVYVPDSGAGAVFVFDTDGNYITQITGAGSPQGGFPHPDQSGLLKGVAVDNSGGPADGNVYVSAGPYANQKRYVQVFSSSGVYRYQIDGSEAVFRSEGSERFDPGPLAVDSDGALRILQAGVVNNSGKRVTYDYLFKYSTTANSATLLSQLPDSGPVPASELSMGIDSTDNLYYVSGGAVHQRDPITNKVLNTFEPISGTQAVTADRATDAVFTSDAGLAEYTPAGALVRRFGGVPNELAWGMAVDSVSDRLFVSYRGEKRIDVFGPPTSVTVPDVALTSVNSSFFGAELSGTINPQGVPSGYRVELKRDDASRWTQLDFHDAGSGSSDEPIDLPVIGLRHSTTYDVRLVGVAKDSGAVSVGPIQTFTTASVPAPGISAPTDVDGSSATLHGTVNPQGVPTTWRFEYSKDGGETWKVGPSGNAGSGTGDVALSPPLSGLDPNTAYQVRLIADHGSGGTATSSVVSFSTDPVPPTVTLVSASRVTDTTARLGASIDAKHAPTTYYFQYGTDASYGSFAPVGQDGDGGAALGPMPAFVKVAGLEPDTIYHYCVTASSIGGSTPCEDHTFKTTTTAAQDWPARGFELVNAPDKGNQAVYRGVDSTVQNLSVSPDAQRVVWKVLGGTSTALMGREELFRASRTPNGWMQESFAPPVSEQGDNDFGYETMAIARDLDQVVATARIDGGSTTSLFTFWPGGKYRRMTPDFPVEITAAWSRAESEDARGFAYEDNLTGEITVWRDGEDVGTLNLPSCQASLITANRYYYSSVVGGRLFVKSASDGGCAGPKNLYAVDTRDGGSPTLISGPPASGPDLGADFLRSNADGTVVLFSTETALAADDANGGNDVYRWTEGSGATCLSCGSAAAGLVPLPVADIPRRVVSRDLSHIYMDLQNGEHVVLLEDGTVHTTPALLSGAMGDIGLNMPNDVQLRMTPDGEVVAFLADGGTADRVIDKGQGPQELYRYEEDAGSLECVSCRDDGLATGDAFFNPFYLSEDGSTLAWTSRIALTPADINGAPDVYEWHNGRVRLVTDGVTEWTSTVSLTAQAWGVSPDGRDLIVGVPAAVTGNEADTYNQVYDARVGSPGFPPTPPPAHCAEDACQGPLQAAPTAERPASSAFAGAGNAVARKAAKRKAKAKKRQKAAKRRRAQKSRQAGHERQGGKR